MTYKSLATIAAISLLFVGGCGKGKKVGSDEIVSAIVPAMCKRMATCNPEAMPNEEFCQSTMKAALTGNPGLKNLETSKKQLEVCLKNIESKECESLLGNKPPEGCEFLQ